MTDTKSLLKKAEVFERLAIYGSRRAFLNSIAQNSDMPNQQFSNARKYLQMAKDTVRDDVLSQLNGNISSAFSSVQSAPSDIPALEKQFNTLNSIRNAIYRKSKDDISGTSNQVALTMGKYLGLVSDLLKSLKESNLEENLLNSSVQPEPPTEDVKSDAWLGKTPSKIDPKVQSSLNELLGIKLKTDGWIGAQTAAALQMYKNKYNNTKHVFDPSLYQDVINSANDKKSGLIRNTPF